MKFSKEFLRDEGGKTIYEKITNTSRWSIYYERVFEHEGRFYITFYSRGATEAQWEVPYEDDPDEIECDEVVPCEVVTVVYRRKDEH